MAENALPLVSHGVVARSNKESVAIHLAAR
jgi:hypothetical protein